MYSCNVPKFAHWELACWNMTVIFSFEKQELNESFYFLGFQNHCRWWLQPWNEKTLTLWNKSMINLDSVLKRRDITLLAKVHIIKGMLFPVVMYGCQSWTIKKAEHQRIDAFKLWFWSRPLSPLDSKEFKPLNPKGNQAWIFIGRTDAEAPILCPPNAKSRPIGKDTDAGKDWRQEEKGMTSMRRLDGIINLWTWVWANSGRLVKDREP